MKKIFLFLTIFSLVAIPAVLFAQETCPQGQLCYTPLEPLPGADQTGGGNFVTQIRDFFRLSVTIGAFLAVTMLVIGGITYMFSEKLMSKSVARDRIKAALWGLAILGGAWLLLNTINPQLISFDDDLLAPATNNETVNQSRGGAAAGEIVRPRPGECTPLYGNGGSYYPGEAGDMDELNRCTAECVSKGKNIERIGGSPSGSYTTYVCR